MKKLLTLILIPLLFSCTNYYYVNLNQDTMLYQSQGAAEGYLLIPANEKVFVQGTKAKKYRKIKYGNYSGWAIGPNYTYAVQDGSTSTSSDYQSHNSSSSSYTTGAPKTVQVRGYTRKDGTYVQPHTRSAPRSKH